MAKTPLNITRTELKNAPALVLDVGGTPVVASAREFSTGSLGWFAAGKATIDVNGKKVQVQVSSNITVIGSKDLPSDGE